MAASNKRLLYTDYHVAWICPLEVELLSARLMLDEEHDPPAYDTHYDDNIYIYGTVLGHATVVATCPRGLTGNVNAGRLTGVVRKTFPNINMTLLVGIGGGVPHASPKKDPFENLHLGDVVVGWSGDGKPAVVHYDFGRQKVDGQYEVLGTIDRPEWRLTNALSIVASDHLMSKTKFQDHLQRLTECGKFQYPGAEQDRLFEADYHHHGEYNSECAGCDPAKLIERPKRTEGKTKKFVFRQGRIATGNSVIQDGEYRDQVSKRCGGVLCFEMEAAGVDASGNCLVIRGVSDYADSHKSDAWKYYAAGNAAVFARELLRKIPPTEIKQTHGTIGRPTEG